MRIEIYYLIYIFIKYIILLSTLESSTAYVFRRHREAGFALQNELHLLLTSLCPQNQGNSH